MSLVSLRFKGKKSLGGIEKKLDSRSRFYNGLNVTLEQRAAGKKASAKLCRCLERQRGTG